MLFEEISLATKAAPSFCIAFAPRLFTFTVTAPVQVPPALNVIN